MAGAMDGLFPRLDLALTERGCLALYGQLIKASIIKSLNAAADGGGEAGNPRWRAAALAGRDAAQGHPD